MKTPIRSGTSRQYVTQWTMQHRGGPRYLEIPTDARVLVVEDQMHRQIKFREWLGYSNANVKIVSTASAAIEEFQQEGLFQFLFLDRDLFQSFGESVAEHLTKVGFDGQVYVTSANPFGAELIEKILKDGGIRVERIPFSMLGIFRAPKEVTVKQ